MKCYFLTTLFIIHILNLTAQSVKPEVVVQTGSSDIIGDLSHSLDGKFIVADSRILDAKTGYEIRSYRCWETAGVTADSKIMVNSFVNKIKKWEVVTGKLLLTIPHEREINKIAITPDGKYVASGNDETSILYINNLSTGALVLNLKEHLLSTAVDDQVVLFIAGHGLLDQNPDYYFATTDVNFDAPSDKGLSYEAFEGLVDGIPARKKLIFIDACHSGEVDKEETTLVNEQILASAIKSRGFKTAKRNNVGLDNSFEMMKELFADLRRGSGAVVISSASGTGFAFESPEWNNSVFTYALLQGLKSKTAG
jgi:hypothetical protein